MVATKDTPEVERAEGTNSVRVVCRKCHEVIRLDFGDMTREQAAEALDKLANRGPAECPGFHVELGGWAYFWRLPEALEAMYGPKQAA
jgi:nitrate/TMAO reductase-like tetraheme cytochrome c subunit